jgi:hypothetical protein
MKWFRSNIRSGSRTALFALAIQLVLSFGHFHGIGAPAAAALQSSAPASSSAIVALDRLSRPAQPQPASDHDSDHDDICAICAVMALASAVLFATPPVLPVPHAVEFSYLITDTEFAYSNSLRVAFQPRAPPLS